MTYLHDLKVRWFSIVLPGLVIFFLTVLFVLFPPALVLITLGFVGSMVWLWWHGDQVSGYVWFLCGLFTGASFSIIGLITFVTMR